MLKQSESLTKPLTLTDFQQARVRELLAIRDSALRDLKGLDQSRLETDWARQRLADVSYANGAIEALAWRLGTNSEKLIRAVGIKKRED